MALNPAKAAFGALLLVGWSGRALAAEQQAGDELQIKLLLDARLRYEQVEQSALDAHALTFRLRAGVEGKIGHFSLLAEAEATTALINDLQRLSLRAARR